jgi:hypothetical protein
LLALGLLPLLTFFGLPPQAGALPVSSNPLGVAPELRANAGAALRYPAISPCGTGREIGQGLLSVALGANARGWGILRISHRITLLWLTPGLLAQRRELLLR